jgi:serine/threonine protein kinase
MLCPSCKAENEQSAENCFRCGKGLFVLTEGSLLASRYKVVSPLGKGGMGMVYKAHDLELDEVVAIKVLRPEAATSPGMTKRFRSEIKLARRVSHPNVCRIHEFGKEGPLSYIVMEYVDGVDFKQILRERGRLPPSDAYSVALQITDALQAIHTEGIIHRDLKTPNVMRNTRGIVKLMDFGIAKSFESGATATATGDIVGTPEYMSPEQAQGGRVDGRSDIYALGIVTFELFTADVPFRSDTPLATLLKQIHDPPPLDNKRELPRAVLPALRKALAKAPQERFQNAREFGDALRRAEGQSPVDVTVTSPVTPMQSAVVPLLIPETAPMATPVPAAVPTVVPPSTGAPLSRPSTGTPVAALPSVLHPRARRSQPRPPAYSRGVLVGAAAALSLLVVGGLWRMRGPREKGGVESPSPSPPSDQAGPVVTAIAAPEPSLAPALDAPVPLAPRDKTELLYGDPARTATSLSWRPVSGATFYHFMLDPGPGFSTPLVDRRDVRDTTLRLSILGAGKYYWRVAAVDKDGHEGSFSPAIDFTVTRSQASVRPTTPVAVAVTPAPSPAPTLALPGPPPRATPSPPPVTAGPAASVPSPSAKEPAPGTSEGAPQTGTLQLLVVPWAEVEVDGMKVGISPPLKPLSLPAGTHAIKLSHPDYIPFRRKVTIRSGETTKLQVDLTKEAFPK